MRIFVWVFGGVSVIVAVLVSAFLMHEKVILGVAASMLNNDIAKVNRLVHKDSTAMVCKSNLMADDRLLGYQLRFTSETDYVIETVCLSGESNLIEKGSLFGGVFRLYGSGVKLTYEDTDYNGWVHLLYGKSVVATGYFDGKLTTRWNADDMEIGGDNPAEAQCTDWGFSCCQTGATDGIGVQVVTNDCVDKCFQSCNQSPLVLFFNTDPLVNQSDRTLMLQGSKATVEFGFQLADYDDGVAEVTLDFGDGTVSPPLREQETGLEHMYSCKKRFCTYQATLMVTDTLGAKLVDLPINTIHVRMEQN